MKKLILFLIAAVSLAACNRPSNPAIITINFKGLTNPLVTFHYMLDDTLQVDSVYVKDGSLYKEIAAKEVMKVKICPHDFIKDSRVIDFYGLYIKPNDKITLNVECKDDYMLVNVMGSELYRELYSVLNRCAPLRAESQKWEFKSHYALKDKDYDKFGVYSEQSAKLRNDYFEIIKEYATANPSSEVCVMLFDWLTHFSHKTELYQIIDKRIFKGSYKEVEEHYLKMVKMAEEHRAKELEKFENESKEAESKGVGELAPNFTLENINGQPFALTSLRGKWVVLDFWATWCGPCKASFPKMKKYYEKYNGKLEIVGIVNSSKKEDWRTMVEDLNLSWINLYNPMEAQKGEDAAQIYGITAFPTYVIINKEGRIHKKFIGAQQQLYDELDKILQ